MFNNIQEKREYYRKIMATWRKNNPERVKELSHRYRSANLDLCRKRTRENQVKLNNKKRFGGLRFTVLERDSYTCQKCGKDISDKNMACIHHINGNKQDNQINNLISYCKSCHPTYHYSIGDCRIDGAPKKLC